MISEPPALNKFKKKIAWESIDQKRILDFLQFCVAEDLGFAYEAEHRRDLTSDVCSIEGEGCANLVARENMTLCGIRLLPIIFQAFCANSIIMETYAEDGTEIKASSVIAKLIGKQKDILLIERTALNFLQRLSGVATATKEYVSILDQEGVLLLDTRKTTPGLRVLEKYATGCGGGFNHRMGLFDRILVKDNHIAAKKIKSPNELSFMMAAIKRKKESNNFLVEVEIDDIDQLEITIQGGVDAILLDNFSPVEVKKAVSINQNRVVLEASGGISLNSLREYAQGKPHFISTGTPIHGSRWLDIGLDWS